MSLLRLASRLLSAPSAPALLCNQTRNIHRWVAPTLREIRRRRKMVGPQPVQARSEFLEWNYEAEIFAFGARLKENFQTPLLQQAFVDRSYIVQEEMKQRAVGIEDPVLHLKDNSSLSQKGEELMAEFITSYLSLSLPKYPREGIKAIQKHLMSEEVLAHVSEHLGTKDLILAAEFPSPPSIRASTLKAVVGALAESSGEVRAYEFIRDFILTQLNQAEINEYWTIENPMQLLKDFCKEKKLGEPEPRLISKLGKNTLLASYHVGLYCNKKLIGSGHGEDVTIATEEAAKDSLRNFFGTTENMEPYDFELPVDRVVKSLSKSSTAKAEKM